MCVVKPEKLCVEMEQRPTLIVAALAPGSTCSTSYSEYWFWLMHGRCLVNPEAFATG